MEVFKVYGVSVDWRHLGLIADYMTYQGGFKPMNRMGMSLQSSAFQRISFETSMNFITESSMRNEVDRMCSPSARLVVGLPCRVGTGSFELYQPLHGQYEGVA